MIASFFQPGAVLISATILGVWVFWEFGILAGSCEVLLLTELSDLLDQMEKEIEEFGEVVSIWD